MSKQDLEKVKDFTVEEVTTKMRSGEIIPPPKGKERQEFLKFINSSPEERVKMLADDTTPPKPSGQGDGAPPTPPAVPPAGTPPEATPKPAEPPPEPPVDAEWVKEFGYQDHKTAMEGHKKLLDLTVSQKQAIDRFNANEGKRGKELAETKKAHELLLKENTELKAKLNPKVEKPVRPVRPNFKDTNKYPDGVLDAKYVEDMEQHELAMAQYEEQKDAYDANLRQSAPAPVAPAAPASNETHDADWDNLFDKEIPEFQKRMNIQTSIPIRQIDANYITFRSATSTAEEKAAAKKFLDSVPPADYATYEKVRTAITTVYDFESGYPVLKYKTIEGGLFDNDMLGNGKLFNNTVPVQLSADEERLAREREQNKQNNGVPTIPGSAAAGNDRKLSEHQTPDEERERYSSLLRAYNLAVNGGVESTKKFEASDQYQEYLRLRRKLVGNVPKRAR